MTEGSTAVQISGVSKIYGPAGQGFKALDQVSLDIWDGEFFTLLGPSGCGKTTLLRLIAGFGYASSGDIRLYGESIGTLPPNKRPVNTVFQSYALFPNLSVRDNIAFGLEMQDRPRREIDARVEEMLRLVQMQEMAGRKPNQLSGGQQQRVALARALAPAPKVLLLDEPLSALDQQLRKDMQIELKRLQVETGLTFIFVTHDQEEALTMSDRIGVMNAGRLLQVGTAEEIYERPADRFVARFIGETNLCSGSVQAVEGGRVRIRLDCGPVVGASSSRSLSAGQKVTVAVRPEHGSLHAQPTPDGAPGSVENLLYLGTDTHFHVRLANGEMFVIRRQNRGASGQSLARGTPVWVTIDEGSPLVLAD